MLKSQKQFRVNRTYSKIGLVSDTLPWTSETINLHTYVKTQNCKDRNSTLENILLSLYINVSDFQTLSQNNMEN